MLIGLFPISCLLELLINLSGGRNCILLQEYITFIANYDYTNNLHL